MSEPHSEVATPVHSLGIATGLMILVGAMNAIDSIIVRHLTTDLHPFVIGFFRALFGLLAVLPWIALRPSRLRTRYTTWSPTLRSPVWWRNMAAAPA